MIPPSLSVADPVCKSLPLLSNCLQWTVVCKPPVTPRMRQGSRTSRASPAFLKRAKEDKETYSSDMKDINQQAQDYPNFVGDAYYYDIHKDAVRSCLPTLNSWTELIEQNRPHLEGDYTVRTWVSFVIWNRSWYLNDSNSELDAKPDVSRLFIHAQLEASSVRYCPGSLGDMSEETLS